MMAYTSLVPRKRTETHHDQLVSGSSGMGACQFLQKPSMNPLGSRRRDVYVRACAVICVYVCFLTTLHPQPFQLGWVLFSLPNCLGSRAKARTSLPLQQAITAGHMTLAPQKKRGKQSIEGY